MSAARILVVEDEAALLRIIKRVIARELGVEVDTAADGRVGLAQATVEDYDVIVSDIRMPEMDGITMVENIRAGSGPNRATPVVLITGHHDEGEAAAKQLGARFLGKPFQREMLVELLQALMRADDAEHE